MLPLPHLLGISAAIAIVSAAGGYTYGYSSATDKQVKVSKELEKKYQESLLESVTKNANLIVELENRHEEANAVINDLISKPAGRVYLPSACRATSKPNTPEGGDQPVDASGALSEKIERVLSDGRQRARSIVAEAELELQKCYVVKGYVAENWKLIHKPAQ